MKKILVILTMLFLVGCQTQPMDDLTRMGLSNNVKSFSQMTVNSLGQEVLRDIYFNGILLSPNVQVDFDEDGFRAKEIDYEFGNKVSETIYKYDQNKIIKVMEFNSFGEGYSFTQTSYMDDEKVILDDSQVMGDLIIEFPDADYTFQFINEYNNENALVKAEVVFEDSEPIQKLVYEYNQDGLMTRYAGYDGELVNFEVKVQYNKSLAIAYEFYSEIETYTFELEYELDVNDNWKKMLVYNNDNLLYVVTREYTYK